MHRGLVRALAPSDGHPEYVFLEVVTDFSKDTVLEVLKRRVDSYGVWLSDGAAVYAAGVKVHQADHKVDPDAPKVFHWRAMQRVLMINTVISVAKTFIDEGLVTGAPGDSYIWRNLCSNLTDGT